MPKNWNSRPLPLFGLGEQSAAAPGAYAPGEVAVLRNGIITGPGAVTQQPDWLLADTLKDGSAVEEDACIAAFPFAIEGGGSGPSQGVIFSFDTTDNVIRLHQLLETLLVDRRITAYSSYTENTPPFITGFEFFGKFYFCEYARQATTLRKGMGVYDPASTGTVSIPTYAVAISPGTPAALRFKGIVKHRGANILGWGYQDENTPDGAHVIRYCKWGDADTWVADSGATSAGFFNIGTANIPIIACAQSGRFTIIGKEKEIFALDGDYGEQYYAPQIGGAHGPVSIAGMVSIGEEAAVWMSSEGPAMSKNGGRVTLLGIDKLTNRFLNYMDLLNCSAVHDAGNQRVMWAMRRQFDDDGNPVNLAYRTELLIWDYIRDQFTVSDVPGQIWALGSTKGPGEVLAAPTGTLVIDTTDEITAGSAVINYTPGDDNVDVAFQLQHKVNGTGTWLPVNPLQTADAVVEYRIVSLQFAKLYDVRVRQIRNGQTDSYVESIADFTTAARGTVATPTTVAIEEDGGETDRKGNRYGHIRITFDKYYADGTVEMVLYTNSTGNTDFATALRIADAVTNAGEVNDPIPRLEGQVRYYWLRMETRNAVTVSSEVLATGSPYTVIGWAI